MTPERFALPVAGGRLAGDACGAGPPLLLLHGFTLDRRAWDGPLERLAARHRVVRLDLRGHGASSPPSAPYVLCDDVPRVLDALGIAAAAVVGFSWGGQVALDAALAHPGRVRALGLVDSTLPGHDWSPGWRAMVSELRALANDPARPDGPARAAERWFAAELFAVTRANPALRPVLERWNTPRAGLLWGGRNPGLPLSPPAAGRLAAVRAPTLVVVGERDLPDFRAIADALAAGIPGARKVVLPGVGHLPSLEAPGAVAALLLDFLAAPAAAA